MGIPALKPVLRNIGNAERNRRKPVENLQEKRKENVKKKLTRNFCHLIIFSIKTRTYLKNANSKSLFMFRYIDKKHNV